MKLYYFPGACSLADHIVLEWIGAPCETIRMNRDSIKSQQYLALNPNGAVPLLVDGDLYSVRTAPSCSISAIDTRTPVCSETAHRAVAPMY